MGAPRGTSRAQGAFLWGLLLLYLGGRISLLYADTLPGFAIIILHVVPPALFALVHGSMLYRWKGIAIFAAFCLSFGTLAEIASLRTGFPFGHYYFTEVMGPKILEVPYLLALAYLGIGYVSWILALLILGQLDQPITGMRVFALPLLASFIMVAWDVSMDPAWSTLEHAWIWQQGGAYFGVPITNFLGWFLTGYFYYLGFTLYSRKQLAVLVEMPASYWYVAIGFYAVCAAGNLLLLKVPAAPGMVADAAGKQWVTADIVRSCVLVSLLLMLPIAVLAALRVRGARPVRCGLTGMGC